MTAVPSPGAAFLLQGVTEVVYLVWMPHAGPIFGPEKLSAHISLESLGIYTRGDSRLLLRISKTRFNQIRNK
jgi:hypothetical protein